MITPEEAWAILGDQVRPLGVISVPLSDTLGHSLAEDICADRDLPPADRSARDGYAVRHEDLIGYPCTLKVMGELAAGSSSRPRLTAGTCVRIFTGANVPPSTDTVVMVEHTEERDGLVTINVEQEKGSHILRRGEDARRGTVLLPQGVRLGAAEVGVCAAVGKPLVKVFRRPSIVVICTGSELRGAGDRVKAHEIRDSNGPALCAALADWGFPGVSFSLVADRKGDLAKALRRALKLHDVVLFTGGVSAGAYDFVPDAVSAVGATIRFRGLRMRPGKPTLYASADGNRHIFGLPGNPLSVFTALHEFALPALRRLAGFDARRCRMSFDLPLAEEVQSTGGWTFFKLAKLRAEPGGVSVAAVPSASSADLASAARADGVVIVPPDRTRIVAGEIVSFRPWRPLS